MRYGIRTKVYTNRKPNTNPFQGQTFSTPDKAKAFAERVRNEYRTAKAHIIPVFEVFEVQA